jgi:hypothetical protein
MKLRPRLPARHLSAVLSIKYSASSKILKRSNSSCNSEANEAAKYVQHDGRGHKTFASPRHHAERGFAGCALGGRGRLNDRRVHRKVPPGRKNPISSNGRDHVN